MGTLFLNVNELQDAATRAPGGSLWWPCRRRVVVRIAREVVTFVFPDFVEDPVVVEILTRTQGAQTKDRFGPCQTPPRARHVHPVLDEVATRAFDHTAGDRQAVPQGGVVPEIGRIEIGRAS